MDDAKITPDKQVDLKKSRDPMLCCRVLVFPRQDVAPSWTFNTILIERCSTLTPHLE